MDDGKGHESLAITYGVGLLIATCLGIAAYNVIELTVLIFTTFKKYEGLYFYSLVLASWSIVPYCGGCYLKYYVPTSPAYLYYTLILIGWTFMITGQSLVLYSRLHILYRTTASNAKWVLYMIIANAIVFHGTGFVFVYGMISPTPKTFIDYLPVYEKLQMTKTSRLMRIVSMIQGQKARQLMQHLIIVNILVIVLNATLLAIEYANLYDIEVTYKATVYSIKLKIEFSVLNDLLNIFQGGTSRMSTSMQHPRVYSSTPIRRKAPTPLSQSRMIAGDISPTTSEIGSLASGRRKENGTAGNGTSVKDMNIEEARHATFETDKEVTDRGDGSADRSS